MSTSKVEARRNFLKGVTAAAAGATLLSGLGQLRAAHPAGNEELRVALIGCGGRGRGAGENNLAGCENTKIVAVADAFEGNAKSAAEHFKVAPEMTFWGLDAYKKAINSDVHMVILTTPPGFRPLHYRTAIEAGKHVFMEKPCCVDAPGYRSLLETNEMADKKGLKVGVGLQRRHHKGYVSSVQAIHEGALGDLILLEAYWNGGPIWWRGPRDNYTEMQNQVNNWYHYVWLSGDNICEQHIHNLDVCNWAKNALPVEANGMGSDKMRRLNLELGGNPPITQLFDHHFVEFTYPDGSKMYSQCRQSSGCFSRVTEFAMGTKKLDSGNGPYEIHRIANLDVKDRNGVDFKHGNEFVQEHYALVEAIRQNLPFNEGPYGATSSFTAVLGRMATYSGQIVRWDDAVKNETVLAPGLENYDWDTEPPTKLDANGLLEVALPGVYNPFA